MMVVLLRKFGGGQPSIVGELGERPVGRPVEKAPHQGRDYRRHRVGDEEADAEEALGVDRAAVEDQREESARISMTGICIAPNFSSVSTPFQNFGSTKALVKLSAPTKRVPPTSVVL